MVQRDLDTVEGEMTQDNHATKGAKWTKHKASGS